MKNIFVAGHNGMVGKAIVRKLEQDANNRILTVDRYNLDLKNQEQVNIFFSENKIDQVYLSAAKVGGIYANNEYPAEFIYDNLMIEANVINAAHRSDVNQLLFLGSSCIYPKHAEQPMSESSLLTGTLESTNEPYAIAKIAGIKLCESYNRQYNRDYRSIMPTNLYGQFDNFHENNSHVIPALIRKFNKALESNEKEVIVWGSGKAKREFLHVDDMANACVYIMNITKKEYESVGSKMCSHINVGTGNDCTIEELAYLIKNITGYTGKIIFDTTKPDGTLRKLMDNTKIKELGWIPKISLEAGLNQTYTWYKENKNIVKQK